MARPAGALVCVALAHVSPAHTAERFEAAIRTHLEECCHGRHAGSDPASGLDLRRLPAPDRREQLAPALLVRDLVAGCEMPPAIRARGSTPLGNLYLSMLDHMGVDVDSFGDATGRLL